MATHNSDFKEAKNCLGVVEPPPKADPLLRGESITLKLLGVVHPPPGGVSATLNIYIFYFIKSLFIIFINWVENFLVEFKKLPNMNLEKI
jgi:hypothetical protein